MRTSINLAARILSIVSVLLFTGAAQAEPKAKIGIIAPLTGPLADAGESIKNSAILAQKAFDPENEVELVIEDDAFNAQKTVTIAKKMIDLDKVSGIVAFGSGGALSIADIAEKSKLPFIATALSDKVTENRKYVFRYFLTAHSIAETIQKELARRQYSEIALITSQQEGMISIRDAFLKLPHPPIAVQDEVLPNETDFKTVALKIANAKPAVVVALTFGYQAAILAKQLKAAKYEGTLSSGPTLQIPSVVASADGALEGAWIATADDRSGASYFAKYKETFGNAPVPDGTYAYDSVRLLIAGIKSGDVFGYLSSAKKFTGIFGDAILGANNSYTLTTTIKEIHGEAFVPRDSRK